MSDARTWLERQTEAQLRPVMAAVFMRDALLAVLDLHREDSECGPTGTCRECYGEDWPCATVRTISKALGVTDD